MKKSRRQQEIEARRAADPIAQAIGRDDIDYESDELPTAPRLVAVITGRYIDPATGKPMPRLGYDNFGDGWLRRPDDGDDGTAEEAAKA